MTPDQVRQLCNVLDRLLAAIPHLPPMHRFDLANQIQDLRKTADEPDVSPARSS